MVLKMGFRLPYLQIIRWLYVQVRFILKNFANGDTRESPSVWRHFLESPCVFAMRCGKNRTLFDFLPALQITRAGSACMEMIHGFKEGWIIWHPRGCAGGPARVEPYQWKRALSHSVSGFNPYISMPQATWRCRVEISVNKWARRRSDLVCDSCACIRRVVRFRGTHSSWFIARILWELKRQHVFETNEQSIDFKL